MIQKNFQHEESSPYITVLNSDHERKLVIEAEKNRDLTAADLERNKRINKKFISINKNTAIKKNTNFQIFPIK
jgi:hypothetical protein